jgi:ABC-2 type transport system ATP-binding protein
LSANGGIAVEVRAVTKRYRSIVAVDAVTFDARPGEVLGLLGPNGAGKTTTMRMITGYLRPSTGAVVVGDVDVASDPVGRRRLIGYVPEATALYPEMTVEGCLRHWGRLRRVPRRHLKAAVSRSLGAAGLQHVRRRRIGTLSRGYRQRVAIGQALVHDPAVLVLDEPTAGLDPRQVAETREFITRLARRRTVLLSSHLLGEVTQLCRRVAVLDRGRLVGFDDVTALTSGTHTGTLEEAYLKLVRE